MSSFTFVMESTYHSPLSPEMIIITSAKIQEAVQIWDELRGQWSHVFWGVGRGVEVGAFTIVICCWSSSAPLVQPQHSKSSKIVPAPCSMYSSTSTMSFREGGKWSGLQKIKKGGRGLKYIKNTTQYTSLCVITKQQISGEVFSGRSFEKNVVFAQSVFPLFG